MTTLAAGKRRSWPAGQQTAFYFEQMLHHHMRSLRRWLKRSAVPISR